MGTCSCVDLYLVRHGITKANMEKRYVGQTDVSLAADSRPQLEELKNALQAVSFNRVISSDLRRCTETLHVICPGTQYEVETALREMHFGRWEMKTYEDLKHNQRYRKWVEDPETVFPEEGEKYQEFSKRVEAWLREFLRNSSSGNYLIVTHGGVIRQLLMHVQAVACFWEAPAPHGKAVAVRLEYREECWSCTSLSVVPLPESQPTLNKRTQKHNG
jgi:alpha-ribazole phosphatase